MKSKVGWGLLIGFISYLAGMGTMSLWHKYNSLNQDTHQASNGLNLNMLGHQQAIQNDDDYKNVHQLFNKLIEQSLSNSDINSEEQVKAVEEHFKKIFNNAQDFDRALDNSTSDSNSALNLFQAGTLDQDIGDINEREDKENIYLDIPIKNLDKNSLEIDISDGQISISGKTSIEEREEGDQSFQQMKMVSSFSRSIPTPQNVDDKKAKVEIGEDKVVIRFPKKSKVNI